MIAAPARRARSLKWLHADQAISAERDLAEEIAVALTYGGCSYAVMMATPGDWVDFAYGFSRTEGIVTDRSEIHDLRISQAGKGVVIDIALAPERMDAFWARRRYLAGPVGCGLCGIESITEALRPCPTVASELRVTPTEIAMALAALAPEQPLNRMTRAVHAAAFWRKGTGLMAVREDVGRHNALDKLIGALVVQGASLSGGMVVMTSRLSVELVQKVAVAGAPIIVGMSAPTALAVNQAEAAGITLIGIARDDGFEVLTRPHRIAREATACVA